MQQKSLPACVLIEVTKKKSTETQLAISQLSIGAFFFACRSCEYLKVPQAEKRRTDILCLSNVCVFRNLRELKHNNPWLEYADYVAITFDWQKKDEIMDTVTQMASKDPLLCPVRQWSSVVRIIWAYAGVTSETPVYAVWRYDRIKHIKSEELTNSLQKAVIAIR